MVLLRKNYAIHMYLITFILIKLFSFNSAANTKCVQCGGTAESCSEDLSDQPKECNDAAFKNCFTKIDTSGKIERGCLKSADDCKPENNCVSTDEGKNNQLICKKCDGSDDKCSQTDMNVTDIKYNQICAAGTKNCVIKIVDKLVNRGCANGEDETKCADGNTNNCKNCGKVNCNTGIYPPNRIQCHLCNVNNCGDVTASSALPCLNYDENDLCYTKAENPTSIIRGCKSDSKENKCSSSVEGCSFCNKTNCNNLQYEREPKLQCFQCVGNSTNDDCYKQQTGQGYENCKNKLLYNQSEYCYTQFETNKIQRGCLYDNPALTLDNCKDDGVCNKCNDSNGCNNKSSEFTCIVCRSDLEKNCWDKANEIIGQKCSKGESSPAEGCFQGIWYGVAIRGCVIDASIQTQEVCKDENNKQCVICNTKNCNTKKSSAAQLGIPYALMLIVLTSLSNLK